MPVVTQSVLDVLKRTKVETGQEPVGRSVGRQLVSQMNFMVITVASAFIRADQMTAPEQWQSLNDEATRDDELVSPIVEGTGIDGVNDNMAAAAERAEEVRVREEQGLLVPMDQREHALLLRTISQYVSRNLADKASRIELLTKPGHFMLNPWDLPDPIDVTIQRQIERQPRNVDARIEAEAKMMGVDPESLKEQFKVQQARQAAFLHENKQAIVEIVGQLDFEIGNVDEAQAYAAWDKLPATTKLRLAAAADSGMFFEADRQAKRYIVQRVLLGKSMNGILHGQRRVLRREIEAWEHIPQVQRELQEAFSRGASYPMLQPIPPAEGTTQAPVGAVKTTVMSSPAMKLTAGGFTGGKATK